MTALGVAACGGDDSSSGSSGTTAAAATATTSGGATTAAEGGSDGLCAQRDALRASIADLKNIDIVKAGTSGLTDQVADIKQQAQDIVSEAKGDMKPEAEALPVVRPEVGGRVEGPRIRRRGHRSGHLALRRRDLGEHAHEEPRPGEVQLS